MNDPILDAGTVMAATRVTANIAKITDALANDLPPDVVVAPQADGVALSGVMLKERYMTDVRLNTIPLYVKAVLS